MKCVLLIDIGSTNTKAAAIDIENKALAGTAKACTTAQTNICIGINNAVSELESKLGRVSYEHKLACSSAAGGLKMVAVGLVPELTAEAAGKAALSAGAKLIKTYAYELSRSDLIEINDTAPDIVLLSGGTDGGNKENLLCNAKRLAEAEHKFLTVVAGNRSVAEDAARILIVAGKEAVICENVMPEFNVLNIEPARKTIRDLFLKKIIYAKGLSEVRELTDGELMPTPSAVLKAAHLLAEGAGAASGLGDLMVIDIGGATTDVCTVARGAPTESRVVLKGLPEPYVKRTVEGDLGVRYNAVTVAEIAGTECISGLCGLTAEKINRYINEMTNNPEILPGGNVEIAVLDNALARVAARIASERHSGTLEKVYTPMGEAYVQTGKNLTSVNTVIGTGGPVINAVNHQVS